MKKILMVIMLLAALGSCINKAPVTLEDSFKEFIQNLRKTEKSTRSYSKQKILDQIKILPQNGFSYNLAEYLHHASLKFSTKTESRLTQHIFNLDGKKNQLISHDTHSPFQIQGKRAIIPALFLQKYKLIELRTESKIDFSNIRFKKLHIDIKSKAECGGMIHHIIHPPKAKRAIVTEPFHYFKISPGKHLQRYTISGPKLQMILQENQIKYPLAPILFSFEKQCKKISVKKIVLEPDNKANSLYTEASYLRLFENQHYHAIRTKVPQTLTYKLSLPQNSKPKLTFRTFSRHDVNFIININGKRVHQTLKRAGKTEHRIPLGRYSGEEIKLEINVSGQKGSAYWVNPRITTTPKKSLKVIHIIQDALRADHLSQYRYHRVTTPSMDVLAKDGVLFERHYTVSTCTRPAISSLFTSFLPAINRSSDIYDHLNESFVTLAEVLSRAGFETRQIYRNIFSSHFGGNHLGFQVTEPLWHNDDESSSYINYIANNAHKNYYLYLHFINPHAPYEPPKKYRTWLKDGYKNDTKVKRDRIFDPEWSHSPSIKSRKALYDGEIQHNDMRIKKIIDTLKKTEQYDDTMIIYSSDHGESFAEKYSLHYTGGVNDKESWGHCSRKAPPSQVHIPLIIKSKKLPHNLNIKSLSSNLDIVPTIYDLLEIEYPRELLMGKSLLPLQASRNELVISQYDNFSSFIFKHYSYVGKTDSKVRYQTPHSEKFEMLSDHEKNIIGQYFPQIDSLLDQISINIISHQKDRGEIDKEKVKLLRSLGY